MKKLLSIFISLFLFAFFLIPHAFAANDNFSTAAHVTYTVNSSGITHVTFAESLTNMTDKFYATVYKIHLGFQDIQRVVASDNGGKIIPAVNKTSDGEDVSIPLNSPAFGKGKVTVFSFSFDTKDVASLNGSIWEVNIPGLSNASDFTDFTVQVVVPPYFGSPTYIKPATGNTSLTFRKDQLGTSGISLAFGDKQVYVFHLTYHLQNKQLFPVQTEIALAPNTNYQDIEINDISPRPANVIEDTDGNWLAQYDLSPSQIVTITVLGKAYLRLNPEKETLTQNQFSIYTKPNQYWQSNNGSISSLAQKLKTPQAIYEYVVTHLQYNFSRISDNQERLGAVAVLQQPSLAVCLEFTDLFIALARAAGIPARELDGYGYTQNTSQRPLSLQKEVLHAWPEYYDTASQKWIMVDPTWENTTGGVDYFHTFDFDHLTLVVKGVSSTYPVPAGGYKLAGQETEKDVHVSFAPESVEPQPIATAALDTPFEFTAGFLMTATLDVKNTGFVLFPEQEVLATPSIGTGGKYRIPSLPPFGSVALPLSFGKTQFLTNTSDMLTIHFAGKTITKNIRITAFSKQALIIGGIFLAVCSIIIFIIAR